MLYDEIEAKHKDHIFKLRSHLGEGHDEDIKAKLELENKHYNAILAYRE
jgi:hypothetical protein